MDRKEISKKLKDMGISPSPINWGDDIIRYTEIWYDEETNELCSDCGVSVTVGDTLNLTAILMDIEDAIIKHYKKYGITLSYSWI
jgi:hypothetical protein